MKDDADAEMGLILGEVRVLSRQNRFEEAKALLVVLGSLYPSNPEVQFEHWKISCHSDDTGLAARTLSAVCMDPALLETFCRMLLTQLQGLDNATGEPGDEHSIARTNWLTLVPDAVGALIASCLSILPDSPDDNPNAGSLDLSPDDVIRILRHLARMTRDHVQVRHHYLTSTARILTSSCISS